MTGQEEAEEEEQEEDPPVEAAESQVDAGEDSKDVD